MFWAERIDSLLPEEQKPYHLALDLSSFDAGALENISLFLKTLSRNNTRVFTLTLQNGTSYKFNRVFEGVRDFFQNTPDACVIYHHKGTQTPAAALKGLGSLSPVRILQKSSISSTLPFQDSE